LNDFYAKEFAGKLIVRFDDTNPTKENQEFVEAIMEDLKTLGISADVVTYTSDHFLMLQQVAEKMIKSGHAYIDDTPVDLMREWRMSGQASPGRDQPVEKNLELWKEMIEGTKTGLKCCLRAKIDMKHKNTAMRDPTMYRCVPDPPHHRTGSKFKAYPCYDFCCPIVDAHEGVTHAMRTNEYHDRNEQYSPSFSLATVSSFSFSSREGRYHWIQRALGVRHVEMHEYSRLNFVNAVLSKRKLQWFVDQGLVDGWDDPRFPTVRCIMRRGLTITALRDFVHRQGFSQGSNLMEWDKIWALNVQVIDPIAPRYWCVASQPQPWQVTLTGDGTSPHPQHQHRFFVLSIAVSRYPCCRRIPQRCIAQEK
jgi:glutamyl-tRNA synthetase